MHQQRVFLALSLQCATPGRFAGCHTEPASLRRLLQQRRALGTGQFGKMGAADSEHVAAVHWHKLGTPAVAHRRKQRQVLEYGKGRRRGARSTVMTAPWPSGTARPGEGCVSGAGTEFQVWGGEAAGQAGVRDCGGVRGPRACAFKLGAGCGRTARHEPHAHVKAVGGLLVREHSRGG